MAQALTRDKFGNPLTTDWVLPSNTKISKSYTFKPVERKLIVRDSDVRTVVLAVNLDVGIVIFNPTTVVTGGTFNGVDSVVRLDFDTSKMSPTDDLMILYEYIDIDYSTNLELILKELQEQTRLLRKIKE